MSALPRSKIRSVSASSGDWPPHGSRHPLGQVGVDSSRRPPPPAPPHRRRSRRRACSARRAANGRRARLRGTRAAPLADACRLVLTPVSHGRCLRRDPPEPPTSSTHCGACGARLREPQVPLPPRRAPPAVFNAPPACSLVVLPRVSTLDPPTRYSPNAQSLCVLSSVDTNRRRALTRGA